MNTVPTSFLGLTSGRLTVVGEADPRNGRQAALCLCECGQRRVVRMTDLLSGRTRSCGCLRRSSTGPARLNAGEIPLYGKRAAGRVVLVDDGDYDLVMQHRWNVWEKEGRENRREDGPYAQASIRLEDGRKSTIRMHKLITGWPETDHANGDGLDNRRANLRPATRSQNLHNAQSRTGTSSRFKGVAWHKDTKKWQASIKVDGRQRYLGVFTSEEDAAAVYTAAALETQGEYAYARRQLELTLGPLGIVRDPAPEAGQEQQRRGEAANAA